MQLALIAALGALIAGSVLAAARISTEPAVWAAAAWAGASSEPK